MNSQLKKTKRNKLIFSSFIVISLLILVFSAEAVTDMFGFLKKYDVHLSPEVNGKITLGGNPLSNLEVFRGLTYGDDDELIDQAITDENGNFHFKEKNIRSRKPGSMFDESRIRQVIITRYQNKEYMLWHTQTIGIKPSSALTDKLSELNCELNNSEEKIRFTNLEYPTTKHLVHSICRWSEN